MNAVEIADAVSELFQKEFDPAEFPFAFLEAFGNRPTTINRLRRGDSNSSDVPGGVLQRNNVHLAVCERGRVPETLDALRNSPKTIAGKVKFILATDGEWLEAEELVSGELRATPYAELPRHIGFFLPLGGISTVAEIKDNPIDIRATGRLNKLYVELLKENPEWATEARRPDMNHFMARLIFCFFAEDTDIFHGEGLFTKTVGRMTQKDGADVHEVIGELFRAMNLEINARSTAHLRPWANQFPYVNGGLFSGSLEVPHFTRIARSYLLRAGELNWREINPDIFGSMIQAVADDEERGALGMHYTSVPNILKVLNPLFLDDLRTQLEAAGNNPRALLNLRKRMARIRVFDPACGSGNFLVIAYKKMREIEAEINQRRGDTGAPSEIPLRNFCGIELRDFAAEIARLALIIAKFQCDVRHLGPLEARIRFLPLDRMNWIVCGNALRLDWTSVCPPVGSAVKLARDDLFSTPFNQFEIDFANVGGETYICGNPPYVGSKKQSDEQKEDLEIAFSHRLKGWKSLDYIAGWLIKAADYGKETNAKTSFVSTNSICQGQHVPILWPLIFRMGQEIFFAHTSFKWANLASHNAGVTVIILGICSNAPKSKLFFGVASDGKPTVREVDNINAYLVSGPNVQIYPRAKPTHVLAPMQFGNHPYYASSLIFTWKEARQMIRTNPAVARYIRPFYGSSELINNCPRACLWIIDSEFPEANRIPSVALKVAEVAAVRRLATKDITALKLANTPYRFREQLTAEQNTIAIPRVSSENRPYLPVLLLDSDSVIQEKAFAMYDTPLYNLAFIASRLHWVWIGTVCVRLEMRFSYSNTLGWNTFPVPPLTEANKNDLTRCAEEILLAREAHFPATIADLYDPDNMPDNLRRAHDRNDETLERIYIGRRFKNDTERLEKLFAMYTKMTEARPATRKVKAKR